MAKPIISGPQLFNFETIAEALKKEGVLQVVEEVAGLAVVLESLLKNPQHAQHLGEKGAAWLQQQRGSTALQYKYVNALLGKKLDEK